jgi:hypothetical protein
MIRKSASWWAVGSAVFFCAGFGVVGLMTAATAPSGDRFQVATVGEKVKVVDRTGRTTEFGFKHTSQLTRGSSTVDLDLTGPKGAFAGSLRFSEWDHTLVVKAGSSEVTVNFRPGGKVEIGGKVIDARLSRSGVADAIVNGLGNTAPEAAAAAFAVVKDDFKKANMRHGDQIRETFELVADRLGQK